MRPSSQKKTGNFGNLNLNHSFKPPNPGSNQIVSSRKGNFQVYSRTSDKKSTVRGSGVAPAPTPLNTPSLKSENSGKDVMVSLVPTSSSGSAVWTGSAESKTEPDRGQPTTTEGTRPSVASKPAPWTKPAAPTESALPPPPAKGPAMRSWADEDSDEDPEDLIHPPRLAGAAVAASGYDSNTRPAASYASGGYNHPEASGWQRGGGQYGPEDDFRNRQYRSNDQRYSQDSRASYGPSSYYAQGPARYGPPAQGAYSGPPSQTGYGEPTWRNRTNSGENRPRGGSFEISSGDGGYNGGKSYQTGSMYGTSAQPRATANGFPVAATLFGAAPSSNTSEGVHDRPDDPLEEQKALELARLEREALQNKKKQLELQQQRLADLEKERERTRSLQQQQQRKYPDVDNFGSRQAFSHSTEFSRARPPRGAMDFRNRPVQEVAGPSDSVDSWRRAPTVGGLGPAADDTSAVKPKVEVSHNEKPQSAPPVVLKPAWGAGGVHHERMTTASSESAARLQQGSVHLMHRQRAASGDSSGNAAQPQSARNDAETRGALAQHPSGPVSTTHSSSGGHRLYDPKTGEFYSSERGAVAVGKDKSKSSRERSGGAAQRMTKEDKAVKIINHRDRNLATDMTGNEPEESAAARKAKEEAKAKKEARDKEKASRPPHSRGMLFRYTDDAKTLALIERVFLPGESVVPEPASKSGRGSDDKLERRSRLKQAEENKIREYLKKKDTDSEASKGRSRKVEKPEKEKKPFNDADEKRDEDSSTDTAHETAEHLLSNRASLPSGIIAVPSAGVVVVNGNSDFLLSESEALTEFIEVKSRRNAKSAAPTSTQMPPSSGLSSGKKRSRLESNTRRSPSPATQTKIDQTGVVPRAPAPAPAPALKISLDPPAKPAWSAARSTLAVVTGAVEAEDRITESTPKSDFKKQRREEKLAAAKKSKLEKREETKKKKIEFKSRNRSSSDHSAEIMALANSNTTPMQIKLSSSSGGSTAPNSVGTAPLNTGDPYRASSDLLQSSAMESSSAVEDIHAVANTLPRRNINSYQIFVPGKGLQSNEDALREKTQAESINLRSHDSHEKQIVFSMGSRGQAADRSMPAHHFSSEANSNSSAMSNGAYSVMEPQLSGKHWEVPTDIGQFSGFSPAIEQEDRSLSWPVPFIEGVGPDIGPARGGRNKPSSSRLQSWSGANTNTSPRGTKQDVDVNRVSDHGTGSGFVYPFINSVIEKNTSSTNAVAQSGRAYELDSFKRSSESESAATYSEKFAKSSKLGSFEDLDDQVVIHPDGVVEGGDGLRSPGKEAVRTNHPQTGRDRGRGRVAGSGGRNGGFYNHPHAGREGLAESSSGRGSGVASAGRGRGRSEAGRGPPKIPDEDAGAPSRNKLDSGRGTTRVGSQKGGRILRGGRDRKAEAPRETKTETVSQPTTASERDVYISARLRKGSKKDDTDSGGERSPRGFQSERGGGGRGRGRGPPGRRGRGRGRGRHVPDIRGPPAEPT